VCTLQINTAQSRWLQAAAQQHRLRAPWRDRSRPCRRSVRACQVNPTGFQHHHGVFKAPPAPVQEVVVAHFVGGAVVVRRGLVVQARRRVGHQARHHQLVQVPQAPAPARRPLAPASPRLAGRARGRPDGARASLLSPAWGARRPHHHATPANDIVQAVWQGQHTFGSGPGAQRCPLAVRWLPRTAAPSSKPAASCGASPGRGAPGVEGGRAAGHDAKVGGQERAPEQAVRVQDEDELLHGPRLPHPLHHRPGLVVGCVPTHRGMPRFPSDAGRRLGARRACARRTECSGRVATQRPTAQSYTNISRGRLGTGMLASAMHYHGAQVHTASKAFTWIHAARTTPSTTHGSARHREPWKMPNIEQRQGRVWARTSRRLSSLQTQSPR